MQISALSTSKALLRAGAVLRAARAVEGASAAVTGALDPRGILARRDRIVHEWNDDSQVAWLNGAGIELVRGHARLTGERTVAVTAADGTVTELTARHAVAISTGSAATPGAQPSRRAPRRRARRPPPTAGGADRAVSGGRPSVLRGVGRSESRERVRNG